MATQIENNNSLKDLVTLKDLSTLQIKELSEAITKIGLSFELANKKRYLVNVIVPSVNGNKSTNLLLSPKEMAKVRKADKRKGRDSFCLGMDSDLNGNLLHTGYFGLGKNDFIQLLKAQYNLVKNPKLKPIQ